MHPQLDTQRCPSCSSLETKDVGGEYFRCLRCSRLSQQRKRTLPGEIVLSRTRSCWPMRPMCHGNQSEAGDAKLEAHTGALPGVCVGYLY
jgi:hypothetical protein